MNTSPYDAYKINFFPNFNIEQLHNHEFDQLENLSSLKSGQEQQYNFGIKGHFTDGSKYLSNAEGFEAVLKSKNLTLSLRISYNNSDEKKFFTDYHWRKENGKNKLGKI